MRQLSQTARFPILSMILVGAALSSAYGQTTSGSELKKFTNQGGEFHAMMPGTPKYNLAKQGKGPNDVQHQFVAGSPLGVYMVAYQDHPNLNMNDPKVAKTVYTTARDAFQRAVSGERKHYKAVQQNGLIGRGMHLLMPKQGGEVRSRMFVTKHRWYHVFVMGIPQYVNSPQANQFLNSFQVSDAAIDVAIVAIVK